MINISNAEHAHDLCVYNNDDIHRLSLRSFLIRCLFCSCSCSHRIQKHKNKNKK